MYIVYVRVFIITIALNVQVADANEENAVDAHLEDFSSDESRIRVSIFSD